MNKMEEEDEINLEADSVGVGEEEVRGVERKKAIIFGASSHPALRLFRSV